MDQVTEKNCFIFCDQVKIILTKEREKLEKKT